MSDLSGGQAFRPKNIDAVSNVLQRIALDIRNMYTLGYVPASTSAARKEPLRRVSVDAVLATGQKLKTRTRRAYLSGDVAEETSFNVR